MYTEYEIEFRFITSLSRNFRVRSSFALLPPALTVLPEDDRFRPYLRYLDNARSKSKACVRHGYQPLERQTWPGFDVSCPPSHLLPYRCGRWGTSLATRLCAAIWFSSRARWDLFFNSSRIDPSFRCYVTLLGRCPTFAGGSPSLASSTSARRCLPWRSLSTPSTRRWVLCSLISRSFEPSRVAATRPVDFGGTLV